MIIDTITFNGEKELFDIRYNILKDSVDRFRVIEFDQTFSGKPKESTFDQKYDKVEYFYITQDIWSKYHALAKSSPNTEYGKGAEHWVREFCQKESIKDCLTDLRDDDLVFIGDCDEIWNPEYVHVELPKKLKLQVFSYYLNNKSSEEFWGTLVAWYGDIKKGCLNHLRADTKYRTEMEFGWHFTSMGGVENVHKKLTDSYTEETYASPTVLNSLEVNIKTNKDFLYRNFRYQLDEKGWPEYLKNNKDNYKQLLSPTPQQP